MAGINGMRNGQAVLFLNDRKGPGIGKNLIPLRETMSREPFKQPFIVQPDANPVVCLDSGRFAICRYEKIRRYEKICRYEKIRWHEKSAGTKFPVALLSGLLIQPRDLKSATIVTQQIAYYDTPSLFRRIGRKWVQADYKSGRTRRNFREKRNQAGTIQLTILKGLALSNLPYSGENLDEKRGMFCRIPRNVKL